MEEGISVEQHSKYMKDITDKLAAIGAPISEDDQVVTLLGSLPRSLATLVTAIEARMGGVGLDYVQQALIHEEMKQSEQSSQSSGVESAMTGASFRKGTPRYRATCFGYGDVDYVRRDRPRDPPRKPPTCFECGDVGHIRRYYPRKAKWHIAKAAECKKHRKGNSEV